MMSTFFFTNTLELDIRGITATLSLTRSLWTVAGIVSDSDYSDRIQGSEFSTNIKILSSIMGWHYLSPEIPLGAYCKQITFERKLPEILNPSHFASAKEIFFDRTETLVVHVGVQPSSDGVDDEVRQTINTIATPLEQRQRNPLTPTFEDPFETNTSELYPKDVNNLAEYVHP
ncbi:hypothetical protein BGX26_008113 [Mortierella sp. AD094]|nr:hypothetical protein BGX26_008113 [Mortierella sp. AD094]